MGQTQISISPVLVESICGCHDGNLILTAGEYCRNTSPRICYWVTTLPYHSSEYISDE